MAEAISSANADKALEAMGRMFNEARAGELNDYQRGRFEQLAIGFLGSGGEPETRQEWLERVDGQFSLTRKRVEMVKQIAEKATRGNLSQDDQAGLARSLIVLRLFPEKLRQVAGDLMRDNPGKWKDVVTGVSLSLTNPKAGEGFSQGNQVFARAAERTLDFFTKEVNEMAGQSAEPERNRVREVMRKIEESAVEATRSIVTRPARALPARDLLAEELITGISEPVQRIRRILEVLRNPLSYTQDGKIRRVKDEFMGLVIPAGRSFRLLIETITADDIDWNKYAWMVRIVDRRIADEQLKLDPEMKCPGIGGFLLDDIKRRMDRCYGDEDWEEGGYNKIPEQERKNLKKRLSVIQGLNYLTWDEGWQRTLGDMLLFLDGGDEF